MIELIPQVVVLITSSMVAFWSWYIRGQLREEQRKRAKELHEVALTLGPVSIGQTVEATEKPERSPSLDLLKDVERAVVRRLESMPSTSRQQMQKEIQRQMAEVTDRVKRIEDRFPPEAQIEKVASINDALLAERIDQLSKQIQAIESRILSKWDVALTASAIITGLMVIVGATYAVLKTLGRVQ